MNKFLLRTALCLSLTCGLSACSDDAPEKGEEEPEYPTTPFSQILLSEAIDESGAPTVNTTHIFSYQSGRLCSHTFLQNIPEVEFEMKSLTNVTYTNRQAVVSDEYGNVSTYTLNDKGYATDCIREEGGGNTRTYTFSYFVGTEGKYHLENVTETLADGISSINIAYNDNRTLHITQLIDTNRQTFTATAPASQSITNISEIPCLFLAELYPLSLHTAALYGKILGEPYDVLITQIIPKDNTESKETVSYTYVTDERGIVTSCEGVTSSYQRNYIRTVNYEIK